MQLSEAAGATGGRLEGMDVPFLGCATDSRTLARGALFVALRGPNYDGHDFIAHAESRGAAAVMSEHAGSALPRLAVADSRRALGELAAAWRQRFTAPVVGITGSNGKTTVKDMLAAILRHQGNVLATAGNYNNDIGLPLTLFGLSCAHDFAVLELGANHPGEIGALCRIAAPDLAVITQIAPAHLEGFGSIDGVANAKAEIIDGLPDTGIAVLNADDAFFPMLSGRAQPRRVVSFALDAPADIVARDLQIGRGIIEFQLATPSGDAPVRLQLAGRHNVGNALAAAGAAYALGVAATDIAAGLTNVAPAPGRLTPLTGVKGSILLDDSYNSNPASLDAALAAIRCYPGRRWLIIGDMAELGDQALEMHRKAGRAAKRSGIERIYAIGELAAETAAGFGEGAQCFDSREALENVVLGSIDHDCVALIKGSRSMRMERIVKALRG